MKFTIAPMSFGEILSRAMSLLFSRLGLFLVIEVIVVTPTLFMQLFLPEFAMGAGAVLLLVPAIILYPIGSAAMLHVIAEEYLGRPVSLGSALTFAMGRFLPLLGTSILFSLGVTICAMACCIPGIYVWVIWAFWAQVVVMENLSGSSAFSRSKELVSGYFWQVFGVLFVVLLLVAIASVPINMAMTFVLPFQELAPPNPNNPFQGPRLTNYLNFAIFQLVSNALNGIGQIFTAICTTLLYFDMRNRKEAFDVSHIVAWMDQYRDWRDEPIPEDAQLLGGGGTLETGIKQAGDVVPPAPKPETGIKDPNAPRSDDEPPH